jgi:hypothetical protein
MGHNPTRTRIAGNSVDIDSPNLKDGYHLWSAAVHATEDTLERLEESP